EEACRHVHQGGGRLPRVLAGDHAVLLQEGDQIHVLAEENRAALDAAPPAPCASGGAWGGRLARSPSARACNTSSSSSGIPDPLAMPSSSSHRKGAWAWMDWA